MDYCAVNILDRINAVDKDNSDLIMVGDNMIDVEIMVLDESKIQEHKISSINEKPTQRFLINGGIYVLEPEILELLDMEMFLDMPELFRRMIAKNWPTTVFPIREYWIDVGKISDLEKAKFDFSSNGD